MKRSYSLLLRRTIVGIGLLLPFYTASAVHAQQPADKTAPVAKAPYSPLQWEKAISKFEESDKKKPPVKGGIVFVGSSSIVKWTSLMKDFPDRNVLNRGFGGSRLSDSVYYADRAVIPYAPKTVVVYAGDNDLAAGVKPEEVARSYRLFVATVRRALPETRIVFIAIKPSLSRWKIHESIEEANQRIKEWSATQQGLGFVDIYPLMLGTDGKPRPELYVKDGLHMTPAGYAIWKEPVTQAL